MRLKSSIKYSFGFLIALGFAIAVLFLLSTDKKEPKYPETPPFSQKTNLGLIQLTINEKSFKKLEKKRYKALSQGVLETTDTDYVPATVSFNGEEFRAQVRLKGDWTDHLEGEKWSFRVKLKDDKTILGMRKFSLHHPQTRGHYYLAEWLYLKTIKKEELMGLRYTFVEGSIHVKRKNDSEYINKEVGIYALEETFDKRTIESNNLKESVILKFSEDHWWSEVKKSSEIASSFGNNWKAFMNYGLVSSAKYPIIPFSEEKIIQDGTLYKYFTLSKSLLEGVRSGKHTIDEAFDVKKLAMQNAILNLFGAVHGTYIINLRFYYNPITSRLEPIAFDGNSGSRLQKYEHFMFVNQEKDSLYLKELAYALNKVYRPEYLNNLVEDNKEKIAELEVPLKKEFLNKGLAIENLKYNQLVIKNELQRLKSKYGIDDIKLEMQKTDTNIDIPEVRLWVNNRTTLAETGTKFKNKKVYKLSRNEGALSSFTIVKNNKVNFGSHYKISLAVKKGSSGNLFGFRIQGEYPNRVDAVFDFEKLRVKGMSTAGAFKNVRATMEPIGQDWYNCTLSGMVNAEEIKILLGPTTRETNISSWEAGTKERCDLLIVPETLTLKEVSEP